MRGPSMDRWPEDEQQTTVQSCRIAHDIFWFTKKSMNRGWPDQRIEPKKSECEGNEIGWAGECVSGLVGGWVGECGMGCCRDPVVGR